MDFITTNIRLPEEDYRELKKEAYHRRISLSAVIREKLTATQIKSDPLSLISEVKKIAESNSKKLKNWNSLQALREIRDSGK
ncbi:MAG: hypothetical protein ACD_32C00073G0003 [uncultured bacterium]|uniref:Uncharacterized protein n=1 Tax=Candidatus Gottesmanbacteria bacterium RIFCSPLOWO2_01_FULL_42_22 TaxID=1798391 RepID=A0A1F6BK01_9BACT|nr:MAG: hypothetical protein ACD_32C00073G0003 [uncultured bacterium]OGG10704.1 MAG: hypothetical protein A2781_07285 [Candidatus Gottesmanbacteria bacterium RIFCSPHIGHO2_01_FULL_42_27]OGG20154.1 MAG: hypothetical protein A3E72_01190 [Candidatus Gottesmanbacteria bacterium RIFCSPHIGHO2_12_FULL_43_26]OGG34321.1 MAG: hypothetical protein A3G68_05120 [Candidatus Gottesmanbacteria bacterium RIFCSPLOWO2_12_FULL_42_10]OGG36675.1 MAG: hypothetical protein A3J20_05600 [Candidatus Gottesmanbacteria bact